MRGQGFHPEGLRRVMATVKNIEAKLLGQRGSPMRPFAGDKRVHALACGELEFAAARRTTPMRQQTAGPPGMTTGFAPVAR